MVIKTISLREDQIEWIKNQSNFNFSKFIQYELDDYMKLKEKFKKFAEDDLIINAGSVM